LPQAARELGASIGAMQMTMSVYIFGLAVGQLVYGPLSDRFGRCPMLTVGLVIYTVTGLWAAFAPDVDTLIVVRLLQALGGCAGLVIGRAIVRDTALPTEAARRMALMNLMVAVGPGLAPLLGGALTSAFGWRSIFFLLAGLGVVNLACTWKLLPETRSDATPMRLGALAHNYRLLITSPAFIGYAIGGGCATTSMYAFISASPFIFVQELHRPAFEVGIYLAILIVGIWVGSAIAARLSRCWNCAMSRPRSATKPSTSSCGVARSSASMASSAPAAPNCAKRRFCRLPAAQFAYARFMARSAAALKA